MKKMYMTPKSDNFFVGSLMANEQSVGGVVNNVTTEAPQRGGDFMPL